MGRGRGSRLAEASGRLLRRFGLFALGMILAGCAPERASTASATTDPLLGGAPLPRSGPVTAPSAPVAAAPAPLVGPPPLPNASAALSPAALAAGGATADSSLRLGPPPPGVSGPPQPTVLASAPHDGADGWRSAPPPPGGATLRGPESDSPSRPIAMIAPPTAGGAAPALMTNPAAPRDSYADLQDKLAQRKVAFQALEGPDEQGVWRFSCGVPSREQAGAVHRIEVTGAGDNGLNAIRTGIDQIDRYQRQQ
jgi:hypothetical protein